MTSKPPQSAPKQQPDLGPSESALPYQHFRSLVYRVAYAPLAKLAGLNAVANILLIVVAVMALASKPDPQILLVTDDLQVTVAPSLKDASFITRERVTLWAQKAIVAPYTFDYNNYRTQITDALDRYFTDEGAAKFVEALNAEGIPELVKKNNYVVSMALQTAPIIAGETASGENKAWRVTANAKKTYRNSKGLYTSDVSITLIIVRDNSKVGKDRFIAINQYIETPAKGS